jgi:hypothetical protein
MGFVLVLVVVLVLEFWSAEWSGVEDLDRTAGLLSRRD